MKKILIISMMLFAVLNCAQIYPITKNTDVPNNGYVKDLNNDLLPYVGTWKGTWDNKVIYIYLERFKKQRSYNINHIYFKDILIGRFKVLNADETAVLFDNTNLPDNNTKIEGLRFFSVPITQYAMMYIDQNICTTGDIYINIVNSTNTQLQWKYSPDNDILSLDCPYVVNNLPIPQALPTNLVLTKQ
ncbi:DUF6705 family protein [Frigoriflavimonas asaccharolytica]|uniref:DUF6705 domain-containing protein n=1 Tax=Frigoriflavimonas asaccharolytica TaxID=2735899 RepID=A0A8J8G565_9FLAO|nr:DUF6705 family protein [Frigoriflavimonas asaccharolytica]NRS91663.1 hypothetical protein [Frigoriflavimonas asaccharolytica]